MASSATPSVFPPESLSSLPPEIILDISQHLDFGTLLRLANVNIRLNSILAPYLVDFICQKAEFVLELMIRHKLNFGYTNPNLGIDTVITTLHGSRKLTELCLSLVNISFLPITYATTEMLNHGCLIRRLQSLSPTLRQQQNPLVLNRYSQILYTRKVTEAPTQMHNLEIDFIKKMYNKEITQINGTHKVYTDIASYTPPSNSLLLRLENCGMNRIDQEQIHIMHEYLQLFVLGIRWSNKKKYQLFPGFETLVNDIPITHPLLVFFDNATPINRASDFDTTESWLTTMGFSKTNQ